MPAKQLKTMAHKLGISSKDMERYWRQAKSSAKHKKGKRPKDFYAYVMGVAKKRGELKAGKSYPRSESLTPGERFMLAMLACESAEPADVVTSLETTLVPGVTTGAPAGTRRDDDDECEECPEETDSTSSRLPPGAVHRSPGRFGGFQ